MAVKKLCGACGQDALERNPNCAACGNRHARWCRAGDPRGIPTPRKNVCAACGQPAHQTNPDCKTCIKREQRRAKAEGREPWIPFMTTKAMAAPPVPVNTLTTARDVHNHETLTGWLTARRNRLNPTPKKGNEMTTHTTLTGATITDEQLQALALDLVNIQADIAALKEEAARIEEQLKALPNGKYTCGDATLTVSHPRRFNEKKFIETYPVEAFPQFYTTVQKVNLKALAPNLKDEYADDTTARLTIR